MKRISRPRNDCGTVFAGGSPSIMSWAALVCGLCAVAGASADIQYFNALQNPAFSSSFTLDFGANGGPRSASITTTQYTLEADAAGLSSRFLNYHPTVDPILLPGGPEGISTGNIVVTILASSPGTYDPAAGTFTTQDMYRIYFAGDLTAYGLKNGYADLPGAASGTIMYDSALSGTIVSTWAGQGYLGDPENPIVFTYTCQTQTTFTLTPEPATLALLGLGALVARRRR